ncbi:hypothetical protein HME9304_01392 [Flagellimonas maritima]|uniref:DUF2141 domain-containing protein n=1 Tax=Flagellimonas maritima TaxID=1383885 RepID=A0A2Z4LRJ1_9FLAO|nr:DUF2141 domain-containing protein [Allomuricauda aurantiaca]AWX44392.1 hypothetical protein HME9304_01392 [Allomuricauda aurantiaca]
MPNEKRRIPKYLMMKKTIVLFLIATGLSSFASKPEKNPVENGSITVTVNGIEKQKGQIVFMLFDREEGFPKEVDKAFKKGIVSTFDTSATYTFENIPNGKYAIAVFQDENKDGEIETNFIGMPKEPVGASNMTKMGKPSFSKCAVQLQEPSKSIRLKFII